MKKYILFFLILIFKNSSCLIDQIKVFDNKYFCFGDIHLGSSNHLEHKTISNKKLKAVHTKQVKDIINFAKKINTDNNTLIITEDIYDCSFDKKLNKFFCKQLSESLKSDYTTTMNILNKSCREHNLDIINLEYRQMHNLFFCYNNIKAKAFIKHLDNVIREIEEYNDTEQLNTFYKNKINNFLNINKKFINLLKVNKDKYFNEIKANQELLNKFLESYYQLFDLKLVHKIFENKNKNIIICVGSNHINRIEPILAKINFKVTYDINIQMQAINIDKIVNKIFYNNYIANTFLFLLILFTVNIVIYTKYRFKSI